MDFCPHGRVRGGINKWPGTLISRGRDHKQLDGDGLIIKEASVPPSEHYPIPFIFQGSWRLCTNLDILILAIWLVLKSQRLGSLFSHGWQMERISRINHQQLKTPECICGPRIAQIPLLLIDGSEHQGLRPSFWYAAGKSTLCERSTLLLGGNPWDTPHLCFSPFSIPALLLFPFFKTNIQDWDRIERQGKSGGQRRKRSLSGWSQGKFWPR